MTYHINGVDDVQALTVDRDQHLAVLLRKLDYKKNPDPLINYYQHSHLVDHEAGQGLCGRLDLTAEESTAQTLELKILYYCEQRHCVGGLGQHSFKTIFEIFVAFPTCHNREDSSRIQDTFSQVFLGRRCWGLP